MDIVSTPGRGRGIFWRIERMNKPLKCPYTTASTEDVTRLVIQFEDDTQAKRLAVFEYLDTVYGKFGYVIKHSGPRQSPEGTDLVWTEMTIEVPLNVPRI